MLSAGGPVARRLGDGFEPRPQQADMARAVARCMERRSRLLVEAGTGVGKSFAYLAPALIRAAERKERVVIATNTIALQEQLIEKDAPLLQAALADAGAPRVDVVLVKGRGNYLSVRRLQLASSRRERLLADEPSRRSLATIERWAYQTTDGTLATLPQVERMSVWDRVQSDSGNCMGRRCPNYERCFYQQARRRMETGSVLVCNHALFFSDLALRVRGVGFLPPYDHVILDEAHNVEEVASEHFGLSLSEGRVRHLLNLLHHQRTQRGFLPQLAVKDAESGAKGADALDGAIVRALEAGEGAAAFFDRLADLAQRTGGTTRIEGPGAVENTVTPLFRDLGLRLRRLKEHAVSDEDKFELNSYAERAAAIADDAAALVDQSLPSCAYWIETSGGASGGEDDEDGMRSAPRRRRVTLACSPVEVAPTLRERLFTGEHSVVLTSATLTTGASAFDHIASRLGCDEPETLALGTPFDLASQVELHVDPTMPDPRDPRYVDELTRRVIGHVGATDGGAFVLFTSFATMRKAAERLAPALAEANMPMLVQERDGPRGALLRRFTECDRSVLLGVSSFWQGVDVRGRALRNVIITRLPFDPPDRPLTDARLKLIESRGGDPFREDSLPRAVIRFKQGFGRLIRSSSDTGRVVVLDPRIITKPYGRAFLRAIPEGVRVRQVGRDDEERWSPEE